MFIESLENDKWFDPLGVNRLLRRGNRGMGEGSAHSEHYFATAYLAKVEGSAHSGCYFARNAKGMRGQRPMLGVALSQTT